MFLTLISVNSAETSSSRKLVLFTLISMNSVKVQECKRMLTLISVNSVKVRECKCRRRADSKRRDRSQHDSRFSFGALFRSLFRSAFHESAKSKHMLFVRCPLGKLSSLSLLCSPLPCFYVYKSGFPRQLRAPSFASWC